MPTKGEPFARIGKRQGNTASRPVMDEEEGSMESEIEPSDFGHCRRNTNRRDSKGERGNEAPEREPSNPAGEMGPFIAEAELK